MTAFTCLQSANRLTFMGFISWQLYEKENLVYDSTFGPVVVSCEIILNCTYHIRKHPLYTPWAQTYFKTKFISTEHWQYITKVCVQFIYNLYITDVSCATDVKVYVTNVGKDHKTKNILHRNRGIVSWKFHKYVVVVYRNSGAWFLRYLSDCSLYNNL